MKNQIAFTVMRLIAAVQLLFTGQQIWAAPTCEGNFAPDGDRLVYIEQTAQQSRLRVIAQTIFTGATILQLGTPTMLRGIPMKGISWVRDGNLLTGMIRAYGSGMSPWGKMEIETQSGEASTLTVSIEPVVTFQALTAESLSKLQALYPSLRVSKRGETNLGTGQGESMPKEIKLSLSRSDMPSGESFDESARSLVSTLLNDPNGLLGLRPRSPIMRYEVPKKLKENAFISSNLDFFGNFGAWRHVDGSKWSAYHWRDKAADESLNNTSLSLYLGSQEMSFWLQNAPFVDGTEANLRRVAWALLEVGYDRSVLGAPRARVSGTNGLVVEGVRFDEMSLAFVRVLDAAQNSPKFDKPLSGLSPQQIEFIQDWMLRGFDQSDLPGYVLIRLGDIVQIEK